MLPQLCTSDSTFKQRLRRLLKRQHKQQDAIARQVAQIINKVRKQGDTSLLEYTQQLDKNPITEAHLLRIPASKTKQALDQLSAIQVDDLKLATQRIRDYHHRQGASDWQFTDAQQVTLGQRIRPIQSVCLYTPGGKACYPSSMIMNAIPAQVAGVERLVLVTPAMHGTIEPILLATAALLNISEIYQLGGAQAIAAMAYGTPSIKPVDKIVGPGNAYVAEAKRQVFGEVGIDMIAGPSEVVIVADKSANPEWISADLLAQAEHDEMAMSVLISDHQPLIDQVKQRLPQLLTTMPRRDIIETALEHHSAAILSHNRADSIAIANQIAAEHLQLCIDNPNQVIDHIQHAGAVFLGHYTPVAFGDYLAGCNHVLPTSTSARFCSGLSVDDFQKRMSIVTATSYSASKLYDHVKRLAHNEGLAAHAYSAHLRRQQP